MAGRAVCRGEDQSLQVGGDHSGGAGGGVDASVRIIAAVHEAAQAAVQRIGQPDGHVFGLTVMIRDHDTQERLDRGECGHRLIGQYVVDRRAKRSCQRCRHVRRACVRGIDVADGEGGGDALAWRAVCRREDNPCMSRVTISGGAAGGVGACADIVAAVREAAQAAVQRVGQRDGSRFQSDRYHP